MAKKEVYIKTYQTTKEYESTLDFDGTNDHILISSNAKFNISPNTFSFEAWVYVDGVATDNTIFSRRGTNGFQWFIETTGELVLSNIGTANYTSTDTVPEGRWVHVAVTVDGSNNVTHYIDGIVAGTNVGANFTDESVDLTIGAQNDNITTRPFDGKIQEFRFWDDVRTKQEIVDNMFSKLNGYESNLQAYYRIDEGVGTTALDYASTAVNGTLTNFTGTFWLTTGVAPVYQREYKGFSTEYTFNSITSHVNSGYGSLTFQLPREFDALAEEDPQSLAGYELDVVAFDREQTTGVILFSGEVIISNASVSGASESITYTAASPIERIEKIDLVDTDVVVSYSATEIATIFQDLIDRANSRSQRQVLKYTSTSLSTTSKNLTVTFKNANIADAMKQVFAATDDDWVWYIDTDKTVYLKQISTTPDHLLLFDKDISSIDRTMDRTKIVNTFKLWDGEASPTIQREYVNLDSVDSYGRYVKAVRDGRFTNTTSANEFGERTINTLKDPTDQIEIEVIDSMGGGYDVDNIQVGDTFRILNVSTATNLPELLVVTKKTDYLDYITIIASDRESFVSRELVNLKKEQFQVNNSSHPTGAYTVVEV